MNSEEQNQMNLKVLGNTVNIYLKLLKALGVLFTVMTIFCIPLFIMYSSGEVQSAHTSYLSKITLGNLGQTAFSCNQQNIRAFESITLKCPYGSIMNNLVEFGL